MIIFNETRPANLREALRLRNELRRRLEDLRLPKELTAAIVLALAEILSNIIKNSAPSAGFLGVRLELIGAHLRLETSDDGGSFQSFVDRLSSVSMHETSIMSETGRGLVLINDSLDRFSYEGGPVNRFTGWKSIISSRPLVLIVEDDDTLLDLYAHYLRDFRTVKARSCEDALMVVRDLDVAVIVADLHLGDGLSTSLLQSTKDDFGPLVPFVLVSGTDDVSVPRQALAGGVELFLSKPVSGSQLRASVDLAITRTASRDARVASAFALDLDGLLLGKLPSFICGRDVVVARGNACAGGGDLIYEHSFQARRRIILLDVMGHGVSAKAWAIAYSALCRGLCYASPSDNCAEFLKRLSEVVWNQSAMDSVVATAIVVDLFEDGLVEIASAGHPSPMVISKMRSSQVPVSGPLLGVIAPSIYELASLRLLKDERLVLVTDGVDSGDVSAGGVFPEWLVSVCAEEDLFRLSGRELEIVAGANLGAQPKDDWTVIVIGAARGVTREH